MHPHTHTETSSPYLRRPQNRMTEDPSPASSAPIKANATSLASPVTTTKSCNSNYTTNMASKGAQRKLVSPSNTAENRNPNLNHGSCKRKVSSGPRPGSKDQSNLSSNAADQHLAGQASADFHLISPPRKHVCSSRRCASKNPDHSAPPVTVIPKQLLVSKGAVLPSPQAIKTCECCLPESTEACNMCSHESQLRRWSSDDRDCRALAEGGIFTPFLLPSEDGRGGLNGSHSSQAEAYTQGSFNAAIECCTDIANSWNNSDGNIHCQKVLADSNGTPGWISGEERHLDEEPDAGSSSQIPAEEEASISPTPEKTGNWRLHAVLDSFGSLSPTREGRVKTLVRAFESLLSVTDKRDQAGTKARGYPLQFSYLKSNGSDDVNGERQEDGGQVLKEQDVEEVEHREWDERALLWQNAEDVPNQQYRWTTGILDDADRNETPRQSIELREFSVATTPDAAEDNLLERAEQVLDLSSATKQLEMEQHSHDKVEEKQNAQEDRAIGHKLQASSRPASSDNLVSYIAALHGKEPRYQKPRSDVRRHPTQRFSVDGHFANTAARKRLINKSRKPSLGGSNCMISSSRPPLAQKAQMQPAQEKPRPVKPQPFKLLTEERGHMKEQEFMARLKKLVEEEERLRVPLAQGLPWTTDEPEVPHKPPVKENTRPLDVQLFSDLRAMERAEFDRFIAEKLLQIEERRQEEGHLRKIAEEEEIKRMRQEMIPKAQLMPYFDRPFRPRRSSKRPTIPKEPQFQLNKQQPKRQKCVSSSIC